MDRDSWVCLPPVPPSSLASPMLWVKMLSKTKCDCTLPFRMKLTLWAWSKMLPGLTLPALQALLCISAAHNKQYKAICETAHAWCIFSPLDLCLNLSSYRQCPFLPGGYKIFLEHYPNSLPRQACPVSMSHCRTLQEHLQGHTSPCFPTPSAGKPGCCLVPFSLGLLFLA